MTYEDTLIMMLRRLGIEDDALHRELLDKVKLGLPSFALRYRHEFGKECIDYILSATRHTKDKAYDFNRLDILYHKPMINAPIFIEGIDIRKLDDQMKNISWGLYPAPPNAIPEIASVCDDLWILGRSKDPAAKSVLDQLCQKYWSGTPYDNDLSTVITSKASEHASVAGNEFGFPNVYVAYFIVSGKREQLLCSLLKSGFDCSEVELDYRLGVNQPDFDLHFCLHCPDGLMQFSIHVQKTNENDLLAATYTATYTPHPLINHGIVSGINTAEIESLMAAVNWQDDRTHFVEDEFRDYRYKDELHHIMDVLLETLPSTLTGKFISDQLQAKYWTGSPDFGDLMTESAKEYSKSLASSIITLPVEIHAMAAYNFFCGRPIFLDRAYPAIAGKGNWVKLEHPSPTGNIMSCCRYSGMTQEELSLAVKFLPVKEQSFENITTALLMGERVEVALHSGKTISVEANPERRGLKLFDAQGKRIYTNLALEPGWGKSMPVIFRPFVSERTQPNPHKGPSH